MANHAHAKRLNYRNIFLAGLIVGLVIVLFVLIISLVVKNVAKVNNAGGDPGSVIESVIGSEGESNSEQSSEETGSGDSSDQSSSSINSLDDVSSSSDSKSSSSSESSGGSGGKNVIIPEDTPYNYDTAGKTVRNAFNENGEIDILFPVNVKYYITKDFKTAKLETVEGNYKMDYRAAPHFRDMLAALRKALPKSQLRTYSTIRTYSYQEGLFNKRKQKYKDKGYSEVEAYNAAATSVAIPGTSEHQLGFAADIYIDSLYNKYGELNEHFEETDEYKWLQEHAYEYGFILSYPKDKIKETGIIYEPWHYRYVGIENAKTIRDSGMLLSEWLESQNIIYVYNK